MGARASRAAPALRRQPRRASSEEIVRSILDASALLLDRDGIRGLTTSRIARVAGVSVGSLYQYFPDAKAIVAELARGLEATAVVITGEEAVRLRDASARDMTARVVGLTCSPRLGTARLRRILLREVPRGWILRESRSTDALVSAAITAFFAMRSDEVRQRELSLAVFVAQHAVEGLVEAVLLADPDALSTDSVQRELFHVAWAYLASDAEALDLPRVDPIESLELAAVPDAALTERLLHEPSRRPREAQKRATSARALETRRALLDAAERVLAASGLEGLTVRAIAAKAGCSVGAFYRHFASPLAVAAEVAVELERRAASALDAGIERARDPMELASALVSAYAGETEHAPLRRALLAQIPRRSTDQATAAMLRASIERLTRALAAIPGIRAGEADVLAFFALHAVRTTAEAFVLLEPEGIGASALSRELRELVSCYWLRATSGRSERPAAL